MQFVGDGVSLAITTHGSEITVSIRGEQDCEGPVVRAQGALQQGLFAGLEYLGKGEPSSSNLDIETDEHIRFAPDPLKVTLPLAMPGIAGALLIVLWTLAILHARLGGYLREWGLHFASIFTAIVVTFSWWHVNFLNVGLHNYGFTAGQSTVWTFYGGMAAIIVFGIIAKIIESADAPTLETGEKA